MIILEIAVIIFCYFIPYLFFLIFYQTIFKNSQFRKMHCLKSVDIIVKSSARRSITYVSKSYFVYNLKHHTFFVQNIIRFKEINLYIVIMLRYI